MRLSLDYTRDFFDLQSAGRERREACRADLVGGLVALLSELGAAASEAEGTAQRLWTRMSERGRHYHTPVHVLAMHGWAERLRIALTRAEALAVWYHDAVWSPEAEGDANERASAAYLVQDAVELAIAERHRAVVAEAEQLIGCTAQHLAADVPPECAVVMDLDLAGFASDEAAFAAQSAAVRAELWQLDEETFARGTVAFFEKLLMRDRIYRSEAAAGLEGRARRQLEQEVARLRGATAPAEGEPGA